MTRVFRAGSAVVLLLLFCVCTDSSHSSPDPKPANPNEMRIPRGGAIVVDGVKRAGEWDDASTTQFAVAPASWQSKNPLTLMVEP